MKNYNEMYVELCKDFIKEFFVEHSVKNGGVEIGFFWDEAEKAVCGFVEHSERL